MIKPFTILATKDEPNFGTLVQYSISDRSYADKEDYKGPETHSINAAILVPTGEDIDTYLFNFFVRCGWIKQ
jgi:hypothetical protein